MRARGCRREARRCGWRLCVVCLHYPVRLTTTRTHSCRRMRECADRAADAPLTLLRREHAGTRPPPALRSPAPHRPPTPPPPFNTNRASCQRANWYCIGSRRPTWRLTCAASRRLARWAGSRRCCRCRRMGEGRGGGGGGGTKPGGALPLYRCSTVGRTMQCTPQSTMQSSIQCTVYRHRRCSRTRIPTRRRRSRAALPTCCWTMSAEVGSSRMRAGCGYSCSRCGTDGEGGGRGNGALYPDPNRNRNPLLLLAQVASTDEAVQESAVRWRP